MTDLVGRTLSHYRITSAIGAGGMGEVYRATDTTLGRDVAIKVLPPEVAQDTERLGRFRREAHLLASLNHPNIAAIYGLEEAAGQPFIALELVEGEDLKERLARGAIPVDEALEIAAQIAEALEEAHNQGIVHRDLKPANVKLTPGGKVKVLDFGLAKAWAGESRDGRSSVPMVSQSPTLAHTGTIAGVILGTAAYMAPEQARGKPVDRRADVWAFGVLVWEMLTGRALFSGGTVTDVIAAVVTQEPDLDALPTDTPRAIRRLLSRCLRKDLRQRLPDMGAARLELQEVMAGTAEAETPAAPLEDAVRAERRGRTRERWVWASVALVLSGLAVLLIHQRLTTVPEKQRAAHFVLDSPEDLTFPDFAPPAVSPNGQHVVFAGLSSTGTTQLWIRPLDSPETRALPGTDGAEIPFWSSDNTSVAFSAAGEIRKLVLASGTVQRVCALPRGGMTGGTWNDAGTIVFSSGGANATLYQVSAAGGEATSLTTLEKLRGELGQWWPQFLPGGRQLLVQVGSTHEANAGLHVISLDAPGERRRILPDGARFVYAAGQLLTVRDGVLEARPFDAQRLTAGKPVPIATDVATWTNNSLWGWFSASSDGQLAWLSGRQGEVRLGWFDREGKPLGTLGEPGKYGQVALSPDGKRVVAEVEDAEGRFDLWTMDVARGVASRLTTDPANERDPVWSPDSQELIFSSDATGDQNLLRKGLQESKPPSPLPGGVGATPGKRDIAESWSRTGNTLLYTNIADTERTLWAASLDGNGPPELLMKDRFASDEHHVSPDGQWLTYISTESGRFEVYVEPFRRRGEKVRVSTSGGGQPRWRGDGKELFYLALDGRLMAVNVRLGATGIEVGIPTPLMPADRLKAVVQGPDYDDYDVTADGQRFLVKVAAGQSQRQRIHVLLNWTSPLQ